MKTTIITVMLCLSTIYSFSQVIFCVQKNQTWEIYDSQKKIAVTTDSLDLILQKIGGTINSTPVVQNGQVFIPGEGLVLLPVQNYDHLIVGDEVICLKDSTAWIWNSGLSQWDSLNTESLAPLLFDAVKYQGERYILEYAEYANQKYLMCINTDDSLSQPFGFQDDSLTNAFFIKGISYQETDSAFYLGELKFPIDGLFLDLKVCNGDGSWCFFMENTFPIQTLDYITRPNELGLDQGGDYSIYQVEAIATKRNSGNFVTALDVPALMPAPFIKTNYFLSLATTGNGCYLNQNSEQRLFLHRLQYAGCGVENASFNFDLGLVRYEGSQIFSVDGRDDYQLSKLNVYDSFGQYVASYPVTDPHDACLVDSFTVAFDYIDSGVFYINPPIVINNNTGVRYKIPADQLYPLVADSCVLASGQVLFPSLGDIDHGNSVQMFWVPALQKYIVLRSGRNLGLYPISYPLCAWQFTPQGGVFTLDTQLTHLVNTSPFGVLRNGGHDFHAELEFSDPVTNTWLISQYDNRVCDDPTIDPSYGHTARLEYSSGSWQMSDFRQFEASPSTAMGNIDVFISKEGDTCVVLSAAGGNSGDNIFHNPQVVVEDYTTSKPLVHMNFSLPNLRVVAYQCNATSEKFAVPTVTFTSHEDVDSVYITADSVPVGTWFYWLGNKPVGQSLAIAKASLFEDGGIAVYASGWYSDADTVPGVPEDCGHSRWISSPIWIPIGTTEVTEVSNNNSITVYPNPTRDQIMIRGVENTSVTLMDMTGRVIVTTTENNISLEQYPAGVYFLKISGKIVKIIKV